jgi:3-oxoacyl-[acyl-carrier protein] reductase
MLKNKTAVVTGGTRGIGKAIALALAAEGADIAILYASSTKAAAQVCDEITALGRQVKAYQCDVADSAQVKSTIALVLSDFAGGVDILVNNAGITRDGLLATMSEKDFSQVLATNLTGAFNVTKALYGHFVRKRSGRIINISSVSGLMGNPGQANYAASKAGLIGFTKSIAKELAGRGITCNAVAPGFISTEMTDFMDEGKKDLVKSLIPLKRLGTAEDVAGTVVFLAGDQAGYITGEVIKIDGGLYI